MSSQFTDRARKAMQLANQEAQRYNHAMIMTEHILLGLVRDDAGLAALILREFNVNVDNVRVAVEALVEHGRVWVSGKLPRTPRAHRVIEFAMEEARNLNCTHIDTEHLLLGLLRQKTGVASRVLIQLGVDVKQVREVVNFCAS